MAPDKKQSPLLLIPDIANLPQDDASLRSLAKRISQAVHINRGGEAGNGADDPTSATFATHESEYLKWIERLSSTVAGGKLKDHLAHMEAEPHAKRSGAYEQVKTFQRVFMRGLAKSTTSFGLPRKMPKFIAVVNLSGERLLLYSSSPHLIISLAASSLGHYEACLDGVHHIVSKATTDSSYSVFLAYSLPFQMGTTAAHWECRLLTKNGNEVDDGELGCSLYDIQPCRMPSTLSSDSQLPAITAAQLQAFEKTIKACDLDVEMEKANGEDAVESAEDKVPKLLSMIAMLKADRKRTSEEHKQEIDEMNAKLVERETERAKFMQSSHEKHLKTETTLNEDKASMEVKIKSLEASIKEKEETISKLHGDLLVKSETKEEEIKQLTKRNGELSDALQAVRGQLRKAESEHTEAMRKQEQVYRRMEDELERKLQMAKRSEMTRNESFAKIKSLQKAFDSASNEKTLLVEEMKLLKRRFLAYRVRLAAQLSRRESLLDMTKEARMKHAECAEELRQSASKLAQTGKELEAANEQVKLLKVEHEKDDGPTTNEQGPTMETTAMQTDILQETLQIGELETECVKLRDETVSLKMELARCRARMTKRPPPPSFMPDDGGTTTSSNDATSGPANAPTPAAPSSRDPVLESTIKQLQMALGTVVDLARQSKSHEQSFREAYVKLNAFEQMQMQQPNHVAHPPYNHYMYMQPHINGNGY